MGDKKQLIEETEQDKKDKARAEEQAEEARRKECYQRTYKNKVCTQLFAPTACSFISTEGVALLEITSTNECKTRNKLYYEVCVKHLSWSAKQVHCHDVKNLGKKK